MQLNPESAIEISPKFRFQWEAAQESYVLLYPEGMVKLNQSAGEILKRCDGSRTLKEIVSDLEKAFSATGLEEDVREFLKDAYERGWIRNKQQPQPAP